jgi:hypothetical protein
VIFWHSFYVGVKILPVMKRKYIQVSSIMALQPFVGPWPFLFQFLNPDTVGRTPWMGDISSSQNLYLHTEHHKHRINAQTSMPRVRFKPTTAMFKREETVYGLDRAATVIGCKENHRRE